METRSNDTTPENRSEMDSAVKSDSRPIVGAFANTAIRRLVLPLLIAIQMLVTATAAPPVQLLVPGFSTQELPIELPNVNCLRYRPDGKMVAVCYDGSVWLLSDSDGDRLEDQAESLWKNDGSIKSPLEMVVAPEGVYISASRGIFLLHDGQLEKVPVEWAAPINATGAWIDGAGVDALGLARDADGNLYVAIGTPDFTNPYVLKDGKAGYDVKGDRGAILKFSADRRKRELYATGVRFGVSLAFNRHGDLFCTDQEGATWLSDGNPLDELLHIEPGRHYGFPPSHPTYLPNVIDEPSTFDYGPQHQSTCGLFFNEPTNGGPTFGPANWASDAIVAGYSRGKLYRTALVKSQAGYVARNQLFACLGMLTMDACVAPDGGLVVACHGGKPDWGSGPSGKGKLYKISHSEPDLAIPILAWPNSPTELHIAFDKSLTDRQLSDLGPGVRVEYGRSVGAGDRFESLWPGYKVVQDQKRTARNALKVVDVKASRDRRALIVTTATHLEAVPHSVTLPGLGRTHKADAKRAELPQMPETDLQYDLTGVRADWSAETGNDRWTGWLPHLSLDVARHFTRNSAEHDAYWTSFNRRGKLSLTTSLDTRGLLRPAVQPELRLNHGWPDEKVTLTLRSRIPFAVRSNGGPYSEAGLEKDSEYEAIVSLPTGSRITIEIALSTGNGSPDLTATWSTVRDGRRREWPLSRVFVPWAPAEKPLPTPPANADLPELAGGNWERGRKIFFGEQAGCSKCHTYGFEGGTIGPDLSNLWQRDYASVRRDVTEPSESINPDYVTQHFILKDGRTLTGLARVEGERLLIGDANGQVTTVHRSDVEEYVPSKQSLMPTGIPALLGPDKLRDLLTYLLTEVPTMPEYAATPRPPEPRPYREVKSLLAGSSSITDAPKPLRIALVAGKKDHGPGEHDYPAWLSVWSRLLKMAEATTVETADEWPTSTQFQEANVLVFYQRGSWSPEKARDMDRFFARGGGAVYIHFAVDGAKNAPDFAQRIGLAFNAEHSRWRHGLLDLGFDCGSQHAISRNFERLRLFDESYWNLTGDASKIGLLASGVEEEEQKPLFWTLEPANGRVVVSIPGHFSWTFDDPAFRLLLLRSIAWAGREPVDRFNSLSTPGARVSK